MIRKFPSVSVRVTKQPKYSEKRHFHSKHGGCGSYDSLRLCGNVSGNKEPDKFAKAGFTAEKSEKVDAPIIKELPICVECKLKSYDKETCRLVGEIVNVSVDERVLDKNGNVDVVKAAPITFDPFNNAYIRLGEKVGDAFKAGAALK
mgnify:CR=1 FL=1